MKNGFPIKYSVKTNNIAYYSHDSFIILTNSTGYANFNFNATCTDDYEGAPKFLIGEQQWKAQLNDSLLNYYTDNDTALYRYTNISLRGDITLDLTTPDNESNLTQETTLNFLGATTDDCTNALETTVIYNANTTGSGIICDNTKLVGANAFTCNYVTTTSTTTGYYNTTMYANFTDHYNNFTQTNASSGLFYISPLRRLAAENVTPSTGYYYDLNWNFTVNATSGDEIPMRIELYLKQGSGGFGECSTLPTCKNITFDRCDNCQQQTYYWYKNFTDKDDVGTWFYQIRMINNNTETIAKQTSGTDSFTVEGIDPDVCFAIVSVLLLIILI